MTATPENGPDRSILPLPEPENPPITEIDARRATPPPRFELKPPKGAGAPNVVFILIDNMGFADPSCFGGPVDMAAFDRLAQGGLRYNNFHTAPVCSPTRVALLTGRNSHSANMGGVAEMGTAFPGMTCVRPNSIAPLAEILRLNGYGTAMFGKSHELPPWELSVSGPLDRWPVHSGFDKFYGFLQGESDLYSPVLYDGVTRIPTPRDPEYHVSTDITDQAITWVRTQQSLTPDKPFFIYYAAAGTHDPHHVPEKWIAKYKGKFDQGWDKLREEILSRQIALGIVPPNTTLAPMPEVVEPWSSYKPEEQRVLAREMEVYAGMAEHTDYEIGRLIQAIEDLGELDNTLVVWIAGDNGGSPFGGPIGSFNQLATFNGVPETMENLLERIDDLGGPHASNHYAMGWGQASCTPMVGGQGHANFAATRNATVIHWPKGIEAKGEIRAQFQHIIDLAPTVLEAAGLPEPKVVNGMTQKPLDGQSLLHTLNDAQAVSRHTTQYFEYGGNRGMYQDGWFATTLHKAFWEPAPRATFEAGHLGAVRHRGRLQPRERPGRDAPGEGGGAQGALPDRSREVQRPAARRSRSRALQPCPCRTPRPHGRAYVVDALRGHGRDVRERVHQHEEPLVHHHGRAGDSGWRGGGGGHRARWAHRRMEPLPERRTTEVRLQLVRS